MLSSDRRAFVLSLVLLPLAGCGFRPVYGPGGAAEGLRGRVRIQPPQSQEEFQLVGRLEQRLGRPQAPRYDLNYALETREQGLSITGQQEITRYNVIGRLDFRLVGVNDGKVISSGTLDAFTGYSASASPVATLSAQQDAHERLVVILADRLVTRLLATGAGHSA